MKPCVISTRMIILAATIGATAFLGACKSELQTRREAGMALYQQEKYDAAMGELKQALTIDEFDAKSNTYAGLIHYRAGNYQQASFHFKLALQADPSDEEALAGITASYIRLDKPDLALDFLERHAAVADQVKDPRMERSIGNRRFMKESEERLFLGKGGARVRIAKTYERLGDYDNAKLYYDKALAIEPDNAAILMSLGKMYEKVANQKEAANAYIRAYRIDPATPGVSEALTRVGVAISDLVR